MDEIEDLPSNHPLVGMPTGYVYDAPSVALVKGTVALACGAENGIAGAASGVNYFNLTAFSADWLSRGDCVTSRRRIIDLGADGKILEPLAQETGICDGCSFGEAAFESWCARYVMTGCGPKPRETSFLWPYLGGRELSITGRGDSGACPPYSAKLYHDVGALPVNCGGKFDMTNLPPHGSGSQEELCVQMRDNPRLLQEWVDAAAPFKCPVFSPDDAEMVADCVKTGRVVTFGCGYQSREAIVGSNGVSLLYRLNGGHETRCTGFFRLNGRLGFLKSESWWNILFPGSKWPNHRVVIQTDDGPRTLYPGQCAVWADEWMRCQPECWGIGAPGSL